MHSDSDHTSALAPFLDDGWLAEILFEVKSGKEATVYCCRGGDRAPVPLIAAKVYRPIETRLFRNDAMYLEGRAHMARASRVKRAVDGNSEFGRQVQYATWLAEEWETLSILYEAGADVPRPVTMGERAILMPFLGDETGPAPMLHETRPDRATTARVIDGLLENVELMLDHDCVHGDLSPYNVMMHEGRAIIIDFPQAIDPRLNKHGAALLTRDITNICAWAAKRGVHRPAAKIASRLWTRFVMGELG